LELPSVQCAAGRWLSERTEPESATPFASQEMLMRRGTLTTLGVVALAAATLFIAP